MSILWSRDKPLDQAARAERAAQDKISLAAQMGPHTAPADQYGPLEQAMAAVEAQVYESAEYAGRMSPAEILRTRDSCIGALARAVNNAQLDEAQAMRVYAEGCRAEADALMARPTAALALIRERVKGIIPKQAFEADYSRNWVTDHLPE